MKKFLTVGVALIAASALGLYLGIQNKALVDEVRVCLLFQEFYRQNISLMQCVQSLFI